MVKAYLDSYNKITIYVSKNYYDGKLKSFYFLTNYGPVKLPDIELIGNNSNYNIYEINGSKTGSFRKTTSGYNEYDKYGRKTGSYKTNSNGVTTKYDQYGRKTGSFKKDSSGRVTEYDKYGRKVGSYK